MILIRTVAAALVLLAAGWSWLDERSATAGGAPPVAVPAPAVAPVPSRQPQQLAVVAPAPTPTPTPHPLPGAIVESPTADLCGIGRMPLPASGDGKEGAGGIEALPDPIGRYALLQARSRTVAALRGGSGSARVAALLLQTPDTTDTAATATWAAELLQEAQRSGDPIALRWAESACGWLPEGPACRLSLIKARLRAEPQNALHWAAWAEEQPEAADEAWSGLLQARYWHEVPFALTSVTSRSVPAEVPDYLVLALAADLMGRDGALPSPGTGFMLDRCRAAAGTRREDCDGVARLMVERSDSTGTMWLGRKVAQELGWPAERLAALHDEVRTLQGPDGRWKVDPDQPLRCSTAESLRRYLAGIASRGELGAARANLAAAARR